MMSCGRRVLVTAPILAGLVNTPNFIMRLASPFNVFLVLVFALSARGVGNYEPQPLFTIWEKSPEELVSYSHNQANKF